MHHSIVLLNKVVMNISKVDLVDINGRSFAETSKPTLTTDHLCTTKVAYGLKIGAHS